MMLLTPGLTARHALAALLLLGLCMSASWASAQDKARVVVLKEAFEGSVPDKLKASLRDELKKSVQQDRRGLAFWDAQQTRDALLDKNPALQGCEEERCLTRIGATLQASAGVKTEIFGEAQIYDYKIWIYDLSTGKLALNEKVTCEVCTNEEATALYGRSLRDALKRVTLAKPEPAQPKEPVKPAEPIKPKEPVKPAEPIKPKEPVVAQGPKISVRVWAQPEEALIELGDLPVGSGSATIEVEPGSYQLRASAQGHITREITLEVKKDDKGPASVYMQLAPEVSAVAPVEPGATARQGSTGLTIAGWGLIIAGVAGTGTGAYLLSLDGDTTCTSGEVYQCPRVFNTTVEGSLLLGGGAAMLTTGIFLAILGAGDDEPAPAPGLGLQLGLDPITQQGFLGYGGQF